LANPATTGEPQPARHLALDVGWDGLEAGDTTMKNKQSAVG